MKKIVILLPLIMAAAWIGCSLGSLSRYDPDSDTEKDVVQDGDIVQEDGPPPNCGDGIVDPDEECDDGNDVNGDGCENNCTYSCHDNGECSDGDLCNGEETCNTETHICEGGTPREDGFVCGDEPRSICLGGACVQSTCGDGYTDTGAGEFCDPPGEGACLEGCVLGCDNPDECPDDGNPCNGDEFCNMETHLCNRTEALEDGDVCGNEPRMICIAGTCQESLCGDTFIDSGAEPPEQCDDGNIVEGDGCENDCTFTCSTNDDCDDGNICNGQETCDSTGTHTCLPGTNLPEGETCDDGLFCTETDTCDGAGRCVGEGNPCVDGIDCTSDICDETENTCHYPINEGFCLIDGICYTDGHLDPENTCLICDVSQSNTAWSALPDMTECTVPTEPITGVCCEGVCRPGGNCCTDEDCNAQCSGFAVPCDMIPDPGTCETQIGCTWHSLGIPYCFGDRGCWDITGLRGDDCRFCGCSGAMYDMVDGQWHCTGITPNSCDSFVLPDACLMCGCDMFWDGYCDGTHAECSSNDNEAACITQIDCYWMSGICDSYICMFPL